ncbi:isopenicillin N synthase family oxygenase [Cupriavidus sp. AcVe19-6a]|uniref:isopenicillin N synthase family dioxygenase n=1 Tax=Cupriavidus sp. AcVe19-6a TaxID=2821358 RepID=UPI001AE97887|nr:isopenicillin N synthase family oxygenase [Cupriavidus sp. AcVe19-6a]MBP0639603.1 isopenicillin N synthase family oxygenase [Cupriavidus sp. AcVe19-6a]
MPTLPLRASAHSLQVEPSAAVREVIARGTDLPILDVGPYLAGEPGALEQLGADIRMIQENLGFFAIVNHGIPQALIDESFRQTARLFEIPMEEKLKHRVGYHHQGYLPPKASILQSSAIMDKIALNTKKDTNSAWLFMRNRTADDPKVRANVRHRGLNQWPESLPEFREALHTYQLSMEKLALRLLPMYARALELPAGYFDEMFKAPEYYQRCAYYHPEEHMEEGQYALAPHSDGSFLTLLPMTPVPGLQVMTPSKEWLSVSYVKNALIVNTGQILNRLSNDRFIATPHRVVNPPTKRYALTFFFYPDDDANVGPIPECVGPGETPRYDSRTFYDFFVPYLDDLYHYNDKAFMQEVESPDARQANA